MSWFPDEMIDEHDRPEGSEIRPGVTLERRTMLRMSLAALGLISLGIPRRLLAQDSKDGDLAWETFLEKAVPLAEKLVENKKPNEIAYLHKIAAMIARLKVPEAEFRGRGKISSARHYSKKPFTVVQFKIQAGAGFSWHDHRNYNGLIACTAGEARILSAEIQGDDPTPPKDKTFLIRQTGDRTVTPGKMSHLSRTHDNVHDVHAGKKGATLLDIFTFFPGGGRSAYMNVEEKPKDPEKKIYEATWR